MTVTSQFSLVSEVAAAEPEEAYRHFASKLSVETDPADVMLDLQRGQSGFVILDVRGSDDYEDCHIETAINIPYRQINVESTNELPKDKIIVTYCFGPGCNASTKGAMRLAALGFRVKEMIGGLEYWKRENGKVAGRKI
jgi:rhodanese-related sulfurtransferase